MLILSLYFQDLLSPLQADIGRRQIAEALTAALCVGILDGRSNLLSRLQDRTLCARIQWFFLACHHYSTDRPRLAQICRERGFAMRLPVEWRTADMRRAWPLEPVH